MMGGGVPKITKSSTVSGTQLPRQTLCAVGWNLSLCPSYLHCNWIITDLQTIAELLELTRLITGVSWSHMQIAATNRLKGPVPIKTLISHTSSFHFPVIISSVLTGDQRLPTHLRKDKTRFGLKGSPVSFPSWQLCEKAQEEFFLLSPLWEISCVLIPSLSSLHSAARSKLQNCLFVVWEKNWKSRLSNTDARKVRVLDCL